MTETPGRRRAMRTFLIDIAPLRGSRDFRLLWGGQLVSQVGTQMTSVAVPIEVYRMTGSSLYVGLISVAQLVPLLACSLLGGSLADARDRRRIMLGTQVLLAASSLGLAVNALLPHPALWALFALSAVAAGISGFDGSARRAAITSVVRRERLTAAFALNQSLTQAASLVGPAVAGVVIAAVGVQAAYITDTVSFVVALAAVLGMAPLPVANPVRVGFASVAAGFTYLRGNRPVQAAFLIDLNAMAFGMPRALFPGLGLGFFGGSAATVGLLYAAPGLGASVATMTSGWVSSVRRPGRAVYWAVAAWGASITLFGLVPWLPLALVMLAVAGGADVVSAVFRGALVQLAVPDHLRGRLSAFNMAVVSGGPRLGDTRAGVVAAAAGTEVSVVSGGLLCLAGTLLLARIRPEMARWTLDDAVRDERDEEEAADQALAQQEAVLGPELLAPGG